MAITNPRDKLLYELSDIYDAETQFLQGMQQAIGYAETQQLRDGIQEHIAQTEQQINNLDQVFHILGEQPLKISCDSARGLVSEAQKGMQEAQGGPLRDAMIAGGLSKVEHYEMSSYRTILSGLEQMGRQDAVELLQQNLQQEEETAQKLEALIQQLVQQVSQGTQGPTAPGTEFTPPTI